MIGYFPFFILLIGICLTEHYKFIFLLKIQLIAMETTTLHPLVDGWDGSFAEFVGVKKFEDGEIELLYILKFLLA